MIRINLLPFRAARKKENIRRQVSIALLSVFFVILTIIYYQIYLNNKINDLDTKLKDTKKLLAQVEKQAKKADQIQKALKKLEKKTQVIKNLETKRRTSALLLDNMTKMVVENTSISDSDASTDKSDKPTKRLWFTNFQAQRGNVSIKGIALDNKTVADFMTRLETSKLYKNVNLKTIKQKKVNNLNLKSFEVTCNKVALKKAKTKK
jgi:type IV pilus assembly protein PilN